MISKISALKDRIEFDIAHAVRKCRDMVERYPDVALYIRETDCDVVWVRYPGREAEALMDYHAYDWRELLDNGQPSVRAIDNLVESLLQNFDFSDDFYEVDDDDEDIDQDEDIDEDEDFDFDEDADDDEDADGEAVKALANVRQVLTNITVAGTSHVKYIDDMAPKICAGVALEMRREADNKYDRRAIALYLGKFRIGYVPREKNEILANLLTAGIALTAIVTKAKWRGSWFQIKAAVALPSENGQAREPDANAPGTVTNQDS